MPRCPRLSVDKIKKLINDVERRPYLWNIGQENFNKIFNEGMAWKSIATRLDLSETTVKNKWSNLRDTFYRIITKNPEYIDDYPGDWPFFHDLVFLVTAPQLNKVQGNSPTTESLESDEEEPSEVEPTEDLPHSDDYYDLLFLESLAPYFTSLGPVRRAAMRVKIQDMLMREIDEQLMERQGKED